VGVALTFDLERTPPVESIQMYLVNNELPFSKETILRYLLGHGISLLIEAHVLQQLQQGQHGAAGTSPSSGVELTLAVYEMVVDDAMIAIWWGVSIGELCLCL
jgi:hypothetical protein